MFYSRFKWVFLILTVAGIVAWQLERSGANDKLLARYRTRRIRTFKTHSADRVHFPFGHIQFSGSCARRRRICLSWYHPVGCSRRAIALAGCNRTGVRAFVGQASARW